MKGIGSIFVGIIALFLLIGPFQPSITSGIKGWRTVDTTETSAMLTTGAAETTTNFTLGFDLYQAAVAEIISVTSSNLTADAAPVYGTGYSESSKLLTLGPVGASGTRYITVRYYAETDDTVMRVLGPFLSVLIFGGCAFAILFSMWAGVSSRGRRGR